MTKSGAESIAEERLRQLAKWPAENDDGHQYGELAIAAARLAVRGTDAYVEDPHDVDFDVLQDQSLTPRQRLVIAGALIAAEIDRLDRRASR